LARYLFRWSCEIRRRCRSSWRPWERCALDGLVHSNARRNRKTALLAAVHSAWHLGHVPLGSNPGVRTAPQLEQRAARDRADHPRRARAELISAARPPAGACGRVTCPSYLLLRVAVTAVTVLSIHKRLRRQSRRTATLQFMLLPVALANLALYPIGCCTRRTAHSFTRDCSELRMSDEQEMGPLCL